MIENRSRPAGHWAATDETDNPSIADAARWHGDAESAILKLAAAGRPFDADDVRRCGVGEPATPNQWGAMFSVLRKAGHIVPVGAGISGRRQRRSGLNRLWIGTEWAGLWAL